ncbi:hypothetical protein [Arthrobacter sp. ISL-69]|uniref:hypothetical protein n=1 Tax=Arthrobacter sp. ISL-69 TaxID=2819113 RepID=UPI001BEBDC98|nr:hypothetical protein [Arthrobacter sp. ISL-69]MBT2537228.1 hypothetical protein [Arthrobacter sp. ISL-69]
MITQEMFPPIGLDPDDDEYGDSRLFSIWVVWKGRGKYAVQKFPNDKYGSQLSRAGNWSDWAPEPFRRHQYRFTYDEACTWAEKLRGTLNVNGKTYAQVQEWRAGK